MSHQPRYVRKNSRIYEHSLCQVCGVAGGTSATGRPGSTCRVMYCLACGSEQCEVNGLGHGACGICLIGMLDSYSRGSRGKCGYKSCSKQAVAFAPRVRRVCEEHALTARQDKRHTVAEYVQERLDARDRNWELV